MGFFSNAPYGYAGVGTDRPTTAQHYMYHLIGLRIRVLRIDKDLCISTLNHMSKEYKLPDRGVALSEFAVLNFLKLNLLPNDSWAQLQT